MRIQPIRLLIAFNLVAICGLAALWFDEDGVMRNVRWVAPAPVTPQIARLNVPIQPASASPDPLTFMSILERPLFAPDRKPPPPPPPPAELAHMDPISTVELIGLFSGENGGVLVRVEGQVRRIKLRESIGAWSLKGIAGREATFVQGDDQRVLSLNYSRFGASGGVFTSKAAPTPAVAAVARAANTLQSESRAFLNRRNGVRANAGLPPLQE